VGFARRAATLAEIAGRDRAAFLTLCNPPCHTGAGGQCRLLVVRAESCWVLP